MQNTDGYGSRRAILYARVSTQEQAKTGYSLGQQMEALREYAASEGFEVIEEVTDPGKSGASLERPGMDRVRDLVQAGSVSMVLAQDRDRFAREPAYHYLLRREFEEYGCKLHALNDRGDGSPEGELQMAYLANSPSTSERRPPRGLAVASFARLEREKSSRAAAQTTASPSTSLATVTKWTRRPCPLCGVSSAWPGKRGSPCMASSESSIGRAFRPLAGASIGTGGPSRPSSWTTCTNHTRSMR